MYYFDLGYYDNNGECLIIGENLLKKFEEASMKAEKHDTFAVTNYIIDLFRLGVAILKPNKRIASDLVKLYHSLNGKMNVKFSKDILQADMLHIEKFSDSEYNFTIKGGVFEKQDSTYRISPTDFCVTLGEGITCTKVDFVGSAGLENSYLYIINDKDKDRYYEQLNKLFDKTINIEKFISRNTSYWKRAITNIEKYIDREHVIYSPCLADIENKVSETAIQDQGIPSSAIPKKGVPSAKIESQKIPTAGIPRQNTISQQPKSDSPTETHIEIIGHAGQGKQALKTLIQLWADAKSRPLVNEEVQVKEYDDIHLTLEDFAEVVISPRLNIPFDLAMELREEFFPECTSKTLTYTGNPIRSFNGEANNSIYGKAPYSSEVKEMAIRDIKSQVAIKFLLENESVNLKLEEVVQMVKIGKEAKSTTKMTEIKAVNQQDKTNLYLYKIYSGALSFYLVSKADTMRKLIKEITTNPVGIIGEDDYINTANVSAMHLEDSVTVTNKDPLYTKLETCKATDTALISKC